MSDLKLEEGFKIEPKGNKTLLSGVIGWGRIHPSISVSVSQILDNYGLHNVREMHCLGLF